MPRKSPTYEEGMELVKSLAASLRTHVPPGQDLHNMLNTLSNIGACMLLMDGARQDAVDELAEARDTFTETLQQMTKRDACVG